MSDNLTPEQRKRTMRAVKSQGTSIERCMRSSLAGAGIRGWVTNKETVPGKPDIIFPTHKIAVFIDGCFWHSCPACARPLPASNREYWQKKIQRNIDRDERYNRELSDAGWRVLRIWEHQVKDDSERARFLVTLKQVLRELS